MTNYQRKKDWVICCPGPSLDALHIQEIMRSVGDWTEFAAVNGAINLTDVVYDRWYLGDVEVLHAAYEDVPPHNTGATLCAPLWWAEQIPKNHAYVNEIYQMFDHNRIDTLSLYNDVFEAIGYRPDRNWWNECTLFMAIGHAIISGARKIDVYGADFAGDGYKNGCSYPNARTRHNDRRWQQEKPDFVQMAFELKDLGIQLRREFADAVRL